MYRGFNLSLDYDNKSSYSTGLTKLTEQKQTIKKELDAFLSPDGSLNGAKLEKEWFPQVKADIFISHSHRDQKTAIALAGWLYNNFKLESFIDSTIWGYSDQLLRKLDDRYCKNDGQNTYNYVNRNLSTTHVHMMLGTALAKMMDNTECLFFLNTPNSISSSDAINKKETNSPWLYYETAISSLIKKPLESHTRRTLKLEKAFSLERINESLQVKYTLHTSHLTEITDNDLLKWKNKFENVSPEPAYPLDTLYHLFKV